MISFLRSHRRWLAAGLALGAGCCGGTAYAAFTSVASNGPNSFSASSDLRAPTIDRSVIAKASGGEPGYVRPGGGYQFYANTTDTGSPASGTASVTGNGGQGSASLTGGSFSIGGIAYNWRSASQTWPAGAANGSANYTITATDNAGNQSAASTYSVTVDGTAPTATDVQTANKTGNTAARPDLGDTISYTFSEPIDPQSVLSTWDGTAGTGSVVVRINNVGTSDVLAVYDAANSNQLPLGTVDLKQDYVSANATFGATGTASTMVRSGNTITITLGTPSAGPRTGKNGTMLWTVATGPYDRAGNALGAGTVTESGTADAEF